MKRIILSFLLSFCGASFAQSAPTVVFNSSVNTTISPVTPTLTWSTSGAVKCTASSSPLDAKWSGAVATSGSLAVGPITVATTYTISCDSASDTSANLSWSAPVLNTDGTTITNLAGFKVYEVIGTSNTLVTTINSSITTNYSISGLSVGTHTYYVTAFNTSGVESVASNQGSKSIVASATTSKSSLVDVTKKPGAPASFTIN